MVWYLIGRMFFWLRWFLVPSSTDKYGPKPYIDPDMWCIACGGRSGDLMAVWGQDGSTITVQHRCKVCGARTNHATVAKIDEGLALPHDMAPDSAIKHIKID